LTFWGLTRSKIDSNLLLSPFLYIIIITIALGITLTTSRFIDLDSKERSIYTVAPLIGNTANLGIPLGIALFGIESVGYTSIINIANVFFIYTVGVFFYAKSEFTIQKSLQQIVKIPILWSALAAISFNLFDIPINSHIDRFLQMGAYATIVIQLMIFGIYLASIKIKTIDLVFSSKIIAIKHFVLPAVGFFVIWVSGADKYVGAILLMELIVPLAVNNVNIAALYHCKPQKVTEAVLTTSIFFIFSIFFYTKLFEFIGR
jgi:predicted permease